MLHTTNGRPVRMLLVYPDYTDRDAVDHRSGGNYSEGLASISAVLKQGGHDVRLLHLLYLHSEEQYKAALRESVAAAGGYDVVGFSIRTTALPDSKLYIEWTREVLLDALIICGSYHVTLMPFEVLSIPGVDAVCIGDGEYAELELCNLIRDGGDYTSVESIWFKLPSPESKASGAAADPKDPVNNIMVAQRTVVPCDGYEVVKNPVRPIFDDLERLPIPDFDLFDYANLESVKTGTAIVMMSRGCLFSCTYCGNSQFRNVYPNRKRYARFRSPENGMLYLKTLLSKYPQIKYINFRDAIFNMYPDWFDKFIDMYTAEIHLPFTCNVRFDVLDEDAVRRLAEAGCYTIDVGVESGDEEIRRKYLKRMMTDEQMINACAWFRKYGVRVLTYNIIGLPHEDLRRALKTVKLNARLQSDRIIPNIFYPYPMTELHRIAKEAGFVPDVIPPDCRVPLKQKQFPEHEVLFVEGYFMYFVKRYRRAFKHGEGTAYEKWLDFWFTGPLTPRRFLVFLSDCRRKTANFAKRVLINRMPKLYDRLRKIKNKIK